jgi:hypothetical protein
VELLVRRIAAEMAKFICDEQLWTFHNLLTMQGPANDKATTLSSQWATEAGQGSCILVQGLHVARGGIHRSCRCVITSRHNDTVCM